MALVAVIDIGLDAEFVEGEHTAYTQQDLLLDTVLPVATVELVRDLAIPLGVHIVVGIEQVEEDTAHVDLPQIGVYKTVGIGHIDYHRAAVLVTNLRDRQVVEVLCLVVGDLLTFGREGLCEISVAIEETDSRHIDIAVGSLLEVVTRQDTQTTGIDLQHAGQTILHREIRN